LLGLSVEAKGLRLVLKNLPTTIEPSTPELSNLPDRFQRLSTMLIPDWTSSFRR
jgi:hypothetical protein